MFKTARSFIIALSACVMSAPAAAGPIYGVFNMAADFGGETLIEVVLDDGSTDEINTGQGLYLSGGIGTTFSDGKYDAQATFGWKFTGISASNGDIDWVRFPLEGLIFLNHEKLRLGGGLTYHINNSLKGSGVASSLNADFDNALGFVFEGQYRITDAILMGARATLIEYEIDSVSIDGNSFGVSLTFQFGK